MDAFVVKASTIDLVAIGLRMQEAREGCGLSRPAFVEKFGGAVRTLENNEKGRNEPGVGLLESFRSLGINPNYLLTGDGPKYIGDFSYQRHETTSMPANSVTAGYVALPLYNDVRASAGPGAVNGVEQADDALMFKEDWIKFELGARPQDLCLIRVHGDSMEPTLRAGDVILVDHRACRPDREGIYILRMGEMLIVKRLQAVPGGQVRVISDNPAFDSWVLRLTDIGVEVDIVGRVVWSGRRF